MSTSRNPKIAELHLRELEVKPELGREVVEDVGDQVVVDVAEHHARRRTAPQIEPRPPRMTMARTKIENAELELARR